MAKRTIGETTGAVHVPYGERITAVVADPEEGRKGRGIFEVHLGPEQGEDLMIENCV